MSRDDINNNADVEHERFSDDDAFVDDFDELGDDDIALSDEPAGYDADQDRAAGHDESFGEEDDEPKKKRSLFGRKKKRAPKPQKAARKPPEKKKKTGLAGKIMWATIILSLVASGGFVGIIFLGGAGTSDAPPPELSMNGRSYEAARQQATTTRPAPPPPNKWMSVDEKKAANSQPIQIAPAGQEPEQIAKIDTGNEAPEVLPGIGREISRQEREIEATQATLAQQNNRNQQLQTVIERVQRQYDQQQQKIDQLIALVEKGLASGETMQTGTGDSRVVADGEMKSRLVSALDAKNDLSEDLARLKDQLKKSRSEVAALERKNRDLRSELARSKKLIASTKEDNRMLKMANRDLIAQLEDMQNNDKGIWAGWKLVGISKNMIVLRFNDEVKAVRLYDSFAGITVQKIDVDNHIVKTSAGSIRVEG